MILPIFRMNFRVSFCITSLYNLLLVAYFWGAVQAYKHPRPLRSHGLLVKHTLMLGITVTGLVAYFLLDHGEVFVNSVFKFNNFILHDVQFLSAPFWTGCSLTKPTMGFEEPLISTYHPYFAVSVLVLGFGVQVKSRWPYGYGL